MKHTYTSSGDHLDALEIITKQLVGLLSDSQRAAAIKELTKEVEIADTDQRKEIMTYFISTVEAS